ncbi:hypothetical protein QQX98_002475 [Neonectria punicea]|uniref:Uncharacterized protein n=1 Tax=Neonectria punicea TaxID=979145 RepID=A0ABR1HII3_9HYPO
MDPRPHHGVSPTYAQQMCFESAIAVSKLLRLYEIRFTLRRMNVHGVSIIFSAALILMFALVVPTPTGSEGDVRSHLSVCFRALDELSLARENAKRTRDFLVQLQRYWDVKSRSGVVRDALSKPKTAGDDSDSVVEFSVDWMLRADIPDLSKRGGNFFSVPSGEFISGPGVMN